MSPSPRKTNMPAAQFGDTTYTKVFIGGLAWETQKETVKKYFEQFGEILEAVVILDKNTGRSKGYGFVTFKEAESAKRACADPAPVIDGRRANCNLASLGVQRSRHSTPKLGLQSGGGSAFPVASTFQHYGIQQGIPYNVYGYSSTNYSNYPTNYYTGAYVAYGTGGGTSFYPYVQYGLGFDHFQYPQPHHFQHYSTSIASLSAAPPHHFSAPLSFISAPSSQAGVTIPLAAAAPTLHATATHHQTHSNSLHQVSSV